MEQSSSTGLKFTKSFRNEKKEKYDHKHSENMSQISYIFLEFLMNIQAKQNIV